MITAFAEGENVETITWKGQWIVATDLTFEGDIDKYRITPKPRKVYVNEFSHGYLRAWPTREMADLYSNHGRIACHEIELPPLP